MEGFFDNLFQEEVEAHQSLDGFLSLQDLMLSDKCRVK